jgi:hypothetical protein
LTWVERNRDHIEKIRAYVSDFRSARPPVFEWFQGGRDPLFPYAPESDRGTALLLCFCALYQGIHAEKLIRVLAYLYREYDSDFFRLSKLPFDDLQARMQRLTDLKDWDLVSKVPGILRSVSDFFFKHGRLLPWVHGQADGEETVRVLCEEIFMMGKTSALKSKPRYFLWLLTQLPGAEPARFWTARTMLPITPGHVRFLREFGPLKNRKHSPWTTPEEKLAYCNRFFRMLAPENPWIVYTGLDAYLKPNGYWNAPQVVIRQKPTDRNSFAGKTEAEKDSDPERKWLCRDILGGCLQCALAPDCPGREEI